MMMDILLEEDETFLANSPITYSLQEDHLVTEQAKKLFQLCDRNQKGFIVKMELNQLEGFIPNCSSRQLEKFFDKIDQSGVNFITEHQFIEGIKPVLLHKETQIPDDDEYKDEMRKISSEPNLLKVEFDGIPLRKSNSHNFQASPELDMESLRQKSIDNADDYIYFSNDPSEVFPIRTSDPSYTVSLKDELAVAQPDIDNLSPQEDPYPFSVENRSTEMQRMSRKLYLELENNRISDCSSQIDLRRSIYNPEIKNSPGSRSLADELRDVGITTDDAPPPSEPRPDYSPERIFKVVFVGDSAVGKTCFLHRYCHNRFKPLFNATIGVDFTVKTIKLDKRVIAVQLWDTAGQERFRSITKQYFRKADGVILMYDVTSEQSFLNVRNWIDSVKTGVDDSCVLCLVGNKVDLFANDRSRVLTYKQGQTLAEEFQMLFFETSAYTGYGVQECMREVALKLQEREDKQLEEALKLDMSVNQKRSWCCL